MDFVNIQWIKPLAKKLREIGDKRDKEFQALADEFGDPRFLLDYYVIPYCQHHNPADYHEDDPTRSYVKSQVYDTLQAFLRGEVLERDGRNQLFILADAGMGKTSLLLMLKLWHLFNFWPNSYDCLLLKLGDKSLEQITKHEGKYKTVLLLDALDEDPQARGRIIERLQDILDASRNFRQVLITCRTQFFPAKGLDPFGDAGRVVVGGLRCPMLFLSLFDDAQVEAYLRKRFPDPWHHFLTHKADPRRLKAQEILGSMQSLRFRPLLLSHVDELLKAEGKLSEPFEVFQALVKVLLLREIDKMERQKLNPVPSMDELWAACRLVAVYLQTLGKQELTEEELGELMKKLPAVAHLEKLNFGGRSLLNRNSNKDYRFAHYSIQEFLVIHALRQDCLKPDLTSCPKPAFGQRPRLTAEMLQFLDEEALHKSRTLLDWQEWTVAGLVKKLTKGEIKKEMLRKIPLRSNLKGGGLGPEIVIVPAGDFWMGARKGEGGADKDEYPRHLVTIARPFAIGRYPVTFEEYDCFCQATQRAKPNDRGWGRGKRPVINVSWEDAQEYCVWLSKQTDRHYRLPSEAEWEYAVRAGSDTVYWWGDEFIKGRVNCDDLGSKWSGCQTSPVDAFPANPFGLYYMLGNVWEWVQDEYHNSYEDAPSNGGAWEDDNTSDNRVVRGGTWFYPRYWVRSAYRGWNAPAYRGPITIGFRLARD